MSSSPLTRFERLEKLMNGDNHGQLDQPNPSLSNALSARADQPGSPPIAAQINAPIPALDITKQIDNLTILDTPPEKGKNDAATVSDGLLFSPIEAVTKFCYKFVKRDFQEAIATDFFAGGKIWAREWKLYGVWTTVFPMDKALILVPYNQLRVLVQEIDSRFPTARVNITPDHIDKGLVCDFEPYPSALHPVYLGASSTREEYRNHASQMQPKTPGCDLPDELLTTYEVMIHKAIAVAKRRKGNSDLREQKRATAHAGRNEQLVLARQLLGVTPVQDGHSVDDKVPLVENLTGPYMHPDEPIFVAIDIEAMECNHSIITEVGLAILDINRLRDIIPGNLGETWRLQASARHIRVAEYSHHVNHKFIRGCPDAFEFGESEFVSSQDLVSVLSDIFRSICKVDHVIPTAGDAEAESPPLEQRNVIVVGHDIAQDISYLKSIGFNVLARRSTIHVLDTKDMYRAITGERDPRSLGHILQHFDLRGWNLHNAGNDAVYTLWVLIAMALSS